MLTTIGYGEIRRFEVKLNAFKVKSDALIGIYNDEIKASADAHPIGSLDRVSKNLDTNAVKFFSPNLLACSVGLT